MKETDLFAPIKKWLEDGGNEVYSEVRAKHHMRRADVVGVHGNIITVVEMKTGLNLDLIEQAVLWKNHAHYIYVAVPKPKTYLNEFACRLLRENGIGILNVDFDLRWPNGVASVSLYRKHRPKLHRRITNDIQGALTEHHKHGIPGGSNGGGYITTYRLTMMNVQTYLQRAVYVERTREGWRTLEEILDDVTTHYSSPKPSLSHALREFENDWCECKREGRTLYFRYRPGLLGEERPNPSDVSSRKSTVRHAGPLI